MRKEKKKTHSVNFELMSLKMKENFLWLPSYYFPLQCHTVVACCLYMCLLHVCDGEMCTGTYSVIVTKKKLPRTN